MKKAFDQTVRDLKRGVNKKVLKVPGIEQKVLDATSNEPWGPHGTLLAEIAQASRNYHEYQMIMGVIWKRLNDTGKNWRHVYKALTVLEYLVANGSERVIDEIKEHSYQISTLSGFQYIDSSGRDQGNNVRKKSQSLVSLVNDKERIVEVRQKAAANRDKFRNSSSGGMYRPGTYDDDGHYGSRDDDRNGYGYGRDKEYSYRDDDRHGRDYEERYGRDGYRDDDYRGRNRSIDGYGSRSRSADRDRDRSFDDDGHSSRGSGARADDRYQDGRQHERKFSEQNIGAPPSYEEVVNESRSPAYSERNGETSATAPAGGSPLAPNASSPSAPKAGSSSADGSPGQASAAFGTHASPAGQEVGVVDEFDPRVPVSAVSAATTAPTSTFTAASNSAEIDLLDSLSDVFAPNPLAVVPITSAATTSEVDAQGNFSGSTFSTVQPDSSVMNQPFEDPFGDSPFKALPSADTVSGYQATPGSAASFPSTTNQSSEIPPAVAPTSETASTYDFGDTFSGMTYSPPNVQPSTNSQYFSQELSNSQQETDILADILPPSGPLPSASSHAGFPSHNALQAQPGAGIYGGFNSHAGNMMPVTSNMGVQSMAPVASNIGVQSMAPVASNLPVQSPQVGGNFYPQGGSPGPLTQFNNGNLIPQGGPPGPPTQFNNGNLIPQGGPPGPPTQFNNGNFLPQVSTVPGFSNTHHTGAGPTPQLNSTNYLPPQPSSAPAASYTSDVMGDIFSPSPRMPNSSMSSQPATPPSSGALAIVPQPSKDKFETKSTVWADTLSRGLVNLNISGPKINPLSDIGIDFDAINRKEKRMEKPTTAAVTSTVTMGKAMGSGSGIGRAGAGALRAPPNPMMGPGAGMAMGGYGGMNQPMGMMGMNMGMNMGMMNMGMGQGGQMPPGATMPGGYNPMMGTGGYPPQQPYGGGYR